MELSTCDSTDPNWGTDSGLINTAACSCADAHTDSNRTNIIDDRRAEHVAPTFIRPDTRTNVPIHSYPGIAANATPNSDASVLCIPVRGCCALHHFGPGLYSGESVPSNK